MFSSYPEHHHRAAISQRASPKQLRDWQGSSADGVVIHWRQSTTVTVHPRILFFIVIIYSVLCIVQQHYK